MKKTDGFIKVLSLLLALVLLLSGMAFAEDEAPGESELSAAIEEIVEPQSEEIAEIVVSQEETGDDGDAEAAEPVEAESEDVEADEEMVEAVEDEIVGETEEADAEADEPSEEADTEDGEADAEEVGEPAEEVVQAESEDDGEEDTDEAADEDAPEAETEAETEAQAAPEQVITLGEDVYTITYDEQGAEYGVQTVTDAAFYASALEKLGLSAENARLNWQAFKLTGENIAGAIIKIELSALKKLAASEDGEISVYALYLGADGSVKLLRANVSLAKGSVSFKLEGAGEYAVLIAVTTESEAEQGEEAEIIEGEEPVDELIEAEETESDDEISDETEPTDEGGEEAEVADEEAEPVDEAEVTEPDEEAGDEEESEESEPTDEITDGEEEVSEETDEPSDSEDEETEEPETEEADDTEETEEAEEAEDSDSGETEASDEDTDETESDVEESDTEASDSDIEASDEEESDEIELDDEEIEETEPDDEEADPGDELIALSVTALTGADGADDNDALFETYIQNQLPAKSRSGARRAKAASPSAGALLSGDSLLLYEQLCGYIKEVAAGERASTEFTIDISDFSCYEKYYTAEDLGVTALYVDGKLSADASDAIYNKVFGFSAAINAALYDCPYDLYWYDKTDTGGSTMGYMMYAQRDEDGEVVAVGKFFDIKLTMSVAKAYQNGSSTQVDTTLPKRVTAAVTKINEIVSKYSGKSQYQKVLGFKDEICALVAYNHDALAEGTPYGDPWQLVYVFDGDTTTNVVCEGYSKAFKYLCDLSGVSCTVATGQMVGGTGEGPHMWNIVHMDDSRYYLVDVTNCDEGTIGAPDKLFLKGYSSYDAANSTYIYAANGESISYVLDASTKSTYSATDWLGMSKTDYDPNNVWQDPAFKDHSIVLSGSIGVDFYLYLWGDANDYTGGKVEFSGNKISSTVELKDAQKQSDGTYKFTCYISSIQMAEEITPTFTATYDGNEISVTGEAYSAKAYIDAFVAAYENDASSEKYVKVAKALADYGHYGQPYLSSVNNWTIGTDYADMATYYGLSFDESAIKSAVSQNSFTRTLGSAAERVTYSLKADYETTIRVRVKLIAGQTITGATVDGESAEISVIGNFCYVYISGIKATELSKRHTVIFSDGTEVQVSALSYVNSILTAVEGDQNYTEEARGFAYALYNYAKSFE